MQRGLVSCVGREASTSRGELIPSARPSVKKLNTIVEGVHVYDVASENMEGKRCKEWLWRLLNRYIKNTYNRSSKNSSQFTGVRQMRATIHPGQLHEPVRIKKNLKVSFLF